MKFVLPILSGKTNQTEQQDKIQDHLLEKSSKSIPMPLITVQTKMESIKQKDQNEFRYDPDFIQIAYMKREKIQDSFEILSIVKRRVITSFY